MLVFLGYVLLFILVLLALLIIGFLVLSLPDLARYLRLRRM